MANTYFSSAGVNDALAGYPAVTDAAAGAVSWQVPHADTQVPGDRAYHVRLTDSEGRIATVVYGTLTLAAA